MKMGGDCGETREGERKEGGKEGRREAKADMFAE